MSESRTVRLGICPDADDAFMFYALNEGHVRDPDYEFNTRVEPVDTLNQLARQGELDLSIISLHAYAFIQRQYNLLSCAGNVLESEGGPILVGRQKLNRERIADARIAIPGEQTTANLVLQLWAGQSLNSHAEPFNKILPLVHEGRYDAGLIIDVAQHRLKQTDLTKIVDLCEWWNQETRLPLPVAACAILASREDSDTLGKLVYQSVKYGLDHREQALGYASKYIRDDEREYLNDYVSRYVNDFSLDFGSRGRKAVQTLFNRAYEQELIPNPVNPIFVQVS